MMVSMTMPQARRCCATIDGVEVNMAPHMAMVLEHLLLTSNRVASHEELIAAIWPDPDEEPENALGQLRMYISWLRETGLQIECTRFRGYQLTTR